MANEQHDAYQVEYSHKDTQRTQKLLDFSSFFDFSPKRNAHVTMEKCRSCVQTEVVMSSDMMIRIAQATQKGLEVLGVSLD